MVVKKTGFKTGKSNPYNKLVQELTECEFKLRMERMKPMLAEFANEMGHKMLVVLACTPYKDWPPLAKTAFTYTAKDAPALAELYKAQLPTE